ncbi:MAG: preprotein translocase subunit TatB [Peptococcaceae bacterium BRH_c8a]|nr:MAG: preprotein translocase subunit TatB [Peptococcaceae bacterium BRH_c8a]
MTHKTVDCRGLACPQPVINTKKAMEEKGIASITMIVDNDVARQNVTLFAKNAGYEVTEEATEGAFHLSISHPGEALPQKTDSVHKPETARPAGLGPVYLITTNSLGQGSPDLGQVLIKSLFNTLVEMEPPPAALLLLNTGVFLTCAGSDVISQLEKMHTSGTTVLSCGTCLDYYKAKEKLKIGSISNMFEINNWLYGPHMVITIA